MKPRKIYIPCLRWKQGEYQALSSLTPETKNSILPLIDVAEFFCDIPENSFDFEDGKHPKTIDQHLSKFASRVKVKWGADECFVDLRHVDSMSRLVNGEHPVTYIFNELRSCGVTAIPVIGFDRDVQYKVSVRDVVAIDKRGLCLRVGLEKSAAPKFEEKAHALLSDMKVGPDKCDFILDLGAPENFEPLKNFSELLLSVIKNLPYINQWRSFGLIGHSLPASVSKLPNGLSTLPRNEWRLYKQLIPKLKESNLRIPTFGDYAINHPIALNLNMKFISPKASIKYTVDDNWLISRGEPIRGRNGIGLAQFRDLCELIASSPYYCGATFSFGDNYILKCAKKVVRPGNLSRFREVGTSHHLEMVTRDLANLGAF